MSIIIQATLETCPPPPFFLVLRDSFWNKLPFPHFITINTNVYTLYNRLIYDV